MGPLIALYYCSRRVEYSADREATSKGVFLPVSFWPADWCSLFSFFAALSEVPILQAGLPQQRLYLGDSDVIYGTRYYDLQFYLR